MKEEELTVKEVADNRAVPKDLQSSYNPGASANVRVFEEVGIATRKNESTTKNMFSIKNARVEKRRT